MYIPVSYIPFVTIWYVRNGHCAPWTHVHVFVITREFCWSIGVSGRSAPSGWGGAHNCVIWKWWKNASINFLKNVWKRYFNNITLCFRNFYNVKLGATFQEFDWHSILREINFGNIWISKIAIFPIAETLNFEIW